MIGSHYTNVKGRRGVVLVTLMALGCAWCPVQAADALPPVWRGTGLSMFAVWYFNTPANPASADTTIGSSSVPTVTVEVGLYGSGWVWQLAGMGSLTGYWDMGSTGASMTVDTEVASGSASEILWLQVTYFEDLHAAPFIDVPGATFLDEVITTVETPSTGGAWRVSRSTWSLGSEVANATIILTTNPLRGALVDAIVVDTITSCDSLAPDYDCDGDVDMRDFADFAVYFGSAVELAGSLLADLDGDGELTLDDWGEFTEAMTGPAI